MSILHQFFRCMKCFEAENDMDKTVYANLDNL